MADCQRDMMMMIMMMAMMGGRRGRDLTDTKLITVT
jgi:hypothetical protein